MVVGPVQADGDPFDQRSPERAGLLEKMLHALPRVGGHAFVLDEFGVTMPGAEPEAVTLGSHGIAGQPGADLE